MNKKVSIITPSFNRANVIGETAQSIFDQDYENWEWVIVDDGSTDDSIALISSYCEKDNRVKLFPRDREPKGAATCRNIAVEHCTGDYLIFLDTDDLIAPFCLSQRVTCAGEHPDADFAIFPMLLFKKERNDLNLLWNTDKETNDLERFLTYDPICQGTGTIWQKQSFVNVGMWDEDLALWQDVELHLRSLLKGLRYVKSMNSPPDTYIRISDESLSRTNYHSLPKYRSRNKVFKSVIIAMNKQQLGAHIKGLRTMGYDIVVNGILSGHFFEAQKLIQFLASYPVFSKTELRSFSRYLKLRKFRIYKLSFLDDYLSRKIELIKPLAENSLGKIPYNEIEK
ncbi:MAG: glycosyltransferase family 2 protein [Vicingaceae bacterium]